MGDADLQIVGHHLGGYATEEGEQTDMRAQPVLRRLCPTGLGVDQPRTRQAGHEDLRRAGRPVVHHRDRVAGVVDLHRLAGVVHLAHRQAAPRGLLPFAQQQFELAEPQTVRLRGLVLHPEQLAGDVLVAPQLLVDLGPVRQRPPFGR